MSTNHETLTPTGNDPANRSKGQGSGSSPVWRVLQALLVIIFVILPIMSYVYQEFIAKKDGSDTNEWRNTTRTMTTIEKDENGNMVNVQKEQVNGQVDKDGYFIENPYDK